MELNRKELKKISYDFNSIASRMMRVRFDEYNIILKKFINFIDENEIILDYINLGYDKNYNAMIEYDEVTKSHGRLIFDFGPSTEDESYQIYQILISILENDKQVHRDMSMHYRDSSKYQDIVKEFNDRIVLVLINNIQGYLTKVGIDMGLSENTIYNISGGQVNITHDNSTVNATQNNGIYKNELDSIIKEIVENLSGLSKKDSDSIFDTVEMVKEELTKSEPKASRLRSCITLLAPMITIANGIPVVANNIQKLIDYISPYIN